MKFIRFTLSKGEPFVLPMNMAEQILNSDQQLVLLNDSSGAWSGKTINKAYIICTDRDIEAERTFKIKNTKALPPGTEKPVNEKEWNEFKKGMQKIVNKYKKP